MTEEEGKGKTLTKALEWNLRFCLMEFLFDKQGRVKKAFLKSKNRRTLIEGYDGPYSTDATIRLIVLPQSKAEVHLHGHAKCYFCPVHRSLYFDVFILPLL